MQEDLKFKNWATIVRPCLKKKKKTPKQQQTNKKPRKEKALVKLALFIHAFVTQYFCYKVLIPLLRERPLPPLKKGYHFL
jgi:hypothetical protein